MLEAREQAGRSTLRGSGLHRVVPSVAVFLSALFIFTVSPNQQLGDARYTLLLSHNLLEHGDFRLDRYQLIPPDREETPPLQDYRLERAGGHVYYWYPPGSSILSLPYVQLMSLLEDRLVTPEGRWDGEAEARLTARLAQVLMAGFAALLFLLARELLPLHWSLAVAAVGAFGTPIYSTTSRSLWSETWGVFLVGLSVFLLLRSAAGTAEIPGFRLGTLLSWAYIVRPTNALSLAVTAAYLSCARRQALGRFALGATPWLALLVVYSFHHFGRPLPSYFIDNRLHGRHIVTDLPGHLFSPSRGLLIGVPVLAAVAFLLLRYRKNIRHSRLLLTGMAVVILHLIVISAYHSWGGHSFGPRLSSGMVPWLALLAVLAIDAARSGWKLEQRRLAPRLQIGALSVLGALSIGIHTVGAVSSEAAKWNVIPLDVDRHPERVWDWRQPQFLSPFLEPPGPYPPLPVEGVLLGKVEANRYLGLGWAHPEGEWRWTDGPTASFRFQLDPISAGRLEMELRPFLAGDRLSRQRLLVELNGRLLASLQLHSPEMEIYGLSVPSHYLESQNRLRLRLPDAFPPAALGPSKDTRRLGVALRQIRWQPN